jgi:negative regulator of sigma E activity
MNSHETVDKFLNGLLSPEETTQFLQEVEQDAELRTLLESDRIINSCINKERIQLMNHDLSGVAGAFVAGLASTGSIASSGLLTASYAKKAGMSWITLATSSALSISVCAGAYWFINSNESNPTKTSQKINQLIHVEKAEPISLNVPVTIQDKTQELSKNKHRSLRQSQIIRKKQIVQESNLPPVKKIQLEHSSSKYRPKTEE